jgi:hypothetical protein
VIALHLNGDNVFQHLLNGLDWRNGQWCDAETSDEEISGDLNEDSKDVDGGEPACEVCRAFRVILSRRKWIILHIRGVLLGVVAKTKRRRR